MCHDRRDFKKIKKIEVVNKIEYNVITEFSMMLQKLNDTSLNSWAIYLATSNQPFWTH